MKPKLSGRYLNGMPEARPLLIERPITLDDVLLDEIEEYFGSAVSCLGKCSPLVAPAPPNSEKTATRMVAVFSLIHVCLRSYCQFVFTIIFRTFKVKFRQTN